VRLALEGLDNTIWLQLESDIGEEIIDFYKAIVDDVEFNVGIGFSYVLNQEFFTWK
jgi:hypothetical protein